jgi:peroxiredoxin
MNFFRSFRFAALFICVICLHSGSPACSDETVPGYAEFAALQEKFAAGVEQHFANHEKLTSQAARDELIKSHPANTMYPLFLGLEAKYRGLLVGRSALHHVVSQASGFGFAPDQEITQGGRQALKILAAHYVLHEDLDLFFEWLQPGDCAECKMILREAMRSPHKHVRGNAILRLAEILASESESPTRLDRAIELIEGDAGFAERVAALRTIRARFANVDMKSSRDQALKLLDEVLRDYSDERNAPRTTYGPVLLQIERDDVDRLLNTPRPRLADSAESLRYYLNFLALGQIAPEIAGPDAFGHQLKLSEHRGKVTLLMFSFKGCGPCEAMYPGNRDLLEKYAGRPFALLGVMGDDELATVHEAVRNGKITWPVWWDGERRGPLATRWRVVAWPETYLLDHTGAIRYRELDSALMERAVARLVEEAEKAQAVRD